MYIYIYLCVCYISRTGTRKQRPRERGSIRWLQSGSAKALSVEALCICRVEFSQHNVDSGMLGCQGGLWNDYGAWARISWYAAVSVSATSSGSLFQFKDDIQKVAPHILSIHISPCPTSFPPLAFGLKCCWVARPFQRMSSLFLFSLGPNHFPHPGHGEVTLC